MPDLNGYDISLEICSDIQNVLWKTFAAIINLQKQQNFSHHKLLHIQ